MILMVTMPWIGAVATPSASITRCTLDVFGQGRKEVNMERTLAMCGKEPESIINRRCWLNVLATLINFVVRQK